MAKSPSRIEPEDEEPPVLTKAEARREWERRMNTGLEFVTIHDAEGKVVVGRGSETEK